MSFIQGYNSTKLQ